MRRTVTGLVCLVLSLPAAAFAEGEDASAPAPTEWHVNLGDGTQVFHDQASADAYVKERGFDQFPIDHEASAAAQAKADAEFQAQKAQVDASLQQEIQKAVAGGYTVDINDVTYGSAEALKARRERINNTYVDEHGGEVWLPQGPEQYLREHRENIERIKQFNKERMQHTMDGISGPSDPSYEAAQATLKHQEQYDQDLAKELQQEAERVKKLRPKTLISDEAGKREVQVGAHSK